MGVAYVIRVSKARLARSSPRLVLLAKQTYFSQLRTITALQAVFSLSSETVCHVLRDVCSVTIPIAIAAMATNCQSVENVQTDISNKFLIN
jgi:hypothetical protein